MPTNSATLDLEQAAAARRLAPVGVLRVGCARRGAGARGAGRPAGLAAAIYALSVAALFGASALYHRITWASQAARRWMRRLDHSMIFFLIAGTYTPFALLVLDGTLATVILVAGLGRRARRRSC